MSAQQVVPPTGQNGRPMAAISGSASELVPTKPYANVTIGPVQATRWVEDTLDDGEEGEAEFKAKIDRLQETVEDIVAGQRTLVEDSLDEK